MPAVIPITRYVLLTGIAERGQAERVAAAITHRTHRPVVLVRQERKRVNSVHFPRWCAGDFLVICVRGLRHGTFYEAKKQFVPMLISPSLSLALAVQLPLYTELAS